MARQLFKKPVVVTPEAPSPVQGAVSPWVPVVLSESEQHDLLRRIARRAPGVDDQGEYIVVTRPNGSVVRVQMDGLVPKSWDTMR